MTKQPQSTSNYAGLREAIEQTHRVCQDHAAAAVNQALTLRNWLIGTHIVEYEQHGSDRAEYGERLLERLAKDLKREGIGRLSARSLRLCRQVHLTYPIWQKPSAKFAGSLPSEIWRKVSAKSSIVMEGHEAEGKPGIPFPELCRRVSWSHVVEFIRLEDPLRRAFYEIETIKNAWSVPELHRQINSMLFERVGLSKDKQGVLKLAEEGQLITSPAALFKDPYILEFTGLAEEPHYVESDLETALLDHLQAFLLELGQGFCFEARQQRITVGGDHDYVDLAFYHRLLRCHILVDLKTRKFRPADAGQMNFYLNYYRQEVMAEVDSPPVGLILCTDRERVHVEYATAGLDNQVFVSRYLLSLPSVEQLEEFLAEEQTRLLEALGDSR